MQSAIREEIQAKREFYQEQIRTLDEMEQKLEVVLADGPASPRKRRGRPPGNRTRTTSTGKRRGPGRPLGSKNKPKATAKHTSEATEASA